MKNQPDKDDREDPEVDPAEIEAATERSPLHPTPPEIPEKLEELTEWDQPLEATGEAAHKVLPEDEIPAAEELVEEGIDEADRDQRMAAVDPDFEP